MSWWLISYAVLALLTPGFAKAMALDLSQVRDDQPIAQQEAILRADRTVLTAHEFMQSADPLAFALAAGARPAGPNPGYSADVFWVLVDDLANASELPVSKHVVLRRGAKHQVEAYLAVNSGGAFEPPVRLQPEPASRHFAAVLTVPPHSTARLLLRVESATAISLDLHLWAEDKFRREAVAASWLLGAINGAQFVLGLYMLFLFRGTRDLRYLLTAMTAMANSVYQAHFEGIAFALVWGQPSMSSAAVSFLMGGLASAFNLALLRAMIESRRHLKSVDKYLLFPAMLIFLAFAVSWSVAPLLINRLNALLHIASATVVFATVATVYLRGQIRIKSYLIGVLLNLMLLALFVGKQAGLVSDNMAFDWLLPVISLSATILFAIAVAERFRSEVESNRQAIQRNEAKLSEMVQARTAELSKAKEAAENTLSHLVETQKQLVQSAKLASLGQLVAGVAHEINTPIGVALTASSHLAASTRQTRAEWNAAKLSRTALNRFLDVADESSGMIERNLDRAARLVQSFKQVSVDRSNDLPREVDLKVFIDELITSSASLWRGRAIEVRADVPESLQLRTYPGSLGQVLINLLQNALVHGLADQQEGVVTLSARSTTGGVLIECADNGMGIPAEHIGQIFEPFFTTRRNRGGTGLGLHIVHNLITQQLLGKIAVDSELGRGTRVRIELPDRVEASES